MGKIKRFVLNLIACIFSLFLFLKYVLSLFFVYVFGRLPLRICHNLKRFNQGICEQKEEENMKDEKEKPIYQQKGRIKLQNLFQSIIDSCISLCLTATLVNYNGLLVKFTFLICHKVHHSFLSLIYQKIPEYTKQIENSYSYFLVWAFIFFGFFGLTTQIAFIMDLMNFFTLPTKFIYTILRWIYGRSVQILGKLYEFIRTDETNWITCPYPKKYVTSHYRTTALMLLIVLAQVTALTVFYYVWLSVVIVGLVIVQNLVENIYRLLGHFGYFLCLIKKYHSTQKEKNIKNMLNPFLDPETAIKIIKGTNFFEKNKDQDSKSKTNDTSFIFIAVFRSFSVLGQDHSVQ